MNELSHFNANGDAHMVDVSAKSANHREAIASGRILMQPETLALIASGSHKKGDVLAVARIAGIMACKRTAELVPLCHQVPLSHVAIDFRIDNAMDAVICEARVATVAVTGIEIEALLAVQISLLTVYDMCKAVDRGMMIDKIGLLKKSGGRTGEWTRDT